MRAPSHREKRALTIIEILIALSLISLISSMLFLNGRSLFNDYQVKADIKTFQRYFELGKKLSITYQNDVELRIVQEGKYFTLDLRTSEPGIAKALKICKKTTLGKFSFISLHEQPISQISLLFTGTGWTLPSCKYIVEVGKKKYVIIVDNFLTITPE